MRRKERQVSQEEAIQIIEKCDSCALGLVDGDKPYIIPMNFGHEYNNGELVLYFHCAKEGTKLDIIEKNNKACFEMDCSHELVKAELVCHYGMNYESVVGNGTIEVVEDQAEKIHALKCFMKQYEKEMDFEFEEKHANAVKILKLSVEEFTGKKLKINR